MATTNDMRGRILEAAERVIHRRGVVGATTKEIAREARCAEGTIYNHFPDKSALFVSVLAEAQPEFFRVLGDLPERAGTGSVRAHLEELGAAAVAFFRELIPVTASAIGEPKLLTRFRRSLRERGSGPHLAYARVGAYLRAEQRAGRVAARISPESTAALLLGACYHYAFLRHMVGDELLKMPADRFVKDIVRTLVHGLAPKE